MRTTPMVGAGDVRAADPPRIHPQTGSAAERLGRRTLIRGAGASLATAVAACAAPRGTGGVDRTSGAGSPSATPSPVPSADGRRRTLLVFFSRAGENYSYGGRVDLEVGNTAVAAGFIADLVEVDTFEIVAADPYPDSYDDTVARNSREQDEDARPAIAGAIPDLTAYDTVLLGSGVWNVRAPMIMQTFVEAVDLAGKTVLPFVTYAVSGMGRVAEDYTEMLPESTVGEGLAIRGEEVADSRPEVEDWLRRSGLLT